jgi:hypothetical protein
MTTTKPSTVTMPPVNFAGSPKALPLEFQPLVNLATAAGEAEKLSDQLAAAMKAVKTAAFDLLKLQPAFVKAQADQDRKLAAVQAAFDAKCEQREQQIAAAEARAADLVAKAQAELDAAAKSKAKVTDGIARLRGIIEI